ncbi:polyadenylate-binding protein RBP47-like isoform X1 [Ipomoea triloba]|uniref:polyadenylate-binding protein RBP47-like isoform X1 n=1 Tax=Ipomoea triloba TaxID=35885 RepID=UPI00125E5BB4|nr:polyadenylate-binding protein RBP47-like isoform X1 [Ipomoea triloba]
MEMNNGSESQKENKTEQHKPAPAPAVPVAAAQQPWVPMQYAPPPAAAMVMQHQFMPAPPPYSPHYMPFHGGHHHPISPTQVAAAQPPPPLLQRGGGSNGENRTIWVGDLHHWMDEDYLRNCFSTTGEVTSLKVIRNKQTGFSEGYGFVEFLSHAAAEKVLQSYGCMVMPNTEQHFRLNWATFSMGEKRANNGSDLSIFVGDLAADVTDTLLLDTFSSKYPSVKAAKVVIDANTGRSKGYGFVRFGDDNERSQAMTEMNGVYCSSRPMRIGAATPRKSSGYQMQHGAQGGYVNGSPARGSQSDGDSTNTTIFVGGLDPNVSDEDLRQPFLQYGEVVSVKIPVGKGCGFVQFANRNDAEEALEKLKGLVIGKQTVRLSWGRNPANRQSRSDFVSPWTGPYYGGHFYDGYGYAFQVPHDPNMYAAATTYGAYPMYGAHQPQVS